MGLIERLQARLELKRLEQRYATRKYRNTWMSDAVYVDGEYVFPSAPPTFEPGSPRSFEFSSSSANSSWSWSSKGPAARLRELRRRLSTW